MMRFPALHLPTITNPIAPDDRELIARAAVLFTFGSAILLATAGVAGLAVRVFTAAAWGM